MKLSKLAGDSRSLQCTFPKSADLGAVQSFLGETASSQMAASPYAITLLHLQSVTSDSSIALEARRRHLIVLKLSRGRLGKVYSKSMKDEKNSLLAVAITLLAWECYGAVSMGTAAWKVRVLGIAAVIGARKWAMLKSWKEAYNFRMIRHVAFMHAVAYREPMAVSEGIWLEYLDYSVPGRVEGLTRLAVRLPKLIVYSNADALQIAAAKV